MTAAHQRSPFVQIRRNHLQERLAVALARVDGGLQLANPCRHLAVHLSLPCLVVRKGIAVRSESLAYLRDGRIALIYACRLITPLPIR